MSDMEAEAVASGADIFRYRCGHYRHASEPAGPCAICAEREQFHARLAVECSKMAQLRADLKEAVDALEPFAKAASNSKYVAMGITPRHNTIFMSEFRNAAGVFAKHRPQSNVEVAGNRALTSSELTLQIGELAKAAKPTDIHAFTVLNVLAGALLISKEEEYAKAALAWMRYETSGELQTMRGTNAEGNDLDKTGATEEEIERIALACVQMVMVHEHPRLTPAERRLCLVTVIKRLEQALWIDLKNDVLKEQISDARGRTGP